MKTYNFFQLVNTPMLLGAVSESVNESRTNQAFAVFNTLKRLGVEFNAAFYKRVAKHFVNSDKAVMLAFAEYQAKNMQSTEELDEIGVQLRQIAAANSNNRSKAMREIFDACTAYGIKDAKEIRKRCENALNYHNTGRIYNTWKEWGTARIAAAKAAKAAVRKAKRAAANIATTATATAPEPKPTEPKPNTVHIVFNAPEPECTNNTAFALDGNDIYFDVHFTTGCDGDIEDFFAKYNDVIVNYRKSPRTNIYFFRLHAVESLFDEIVADYSDDDFNVHAVRTSYYIDINEYEGENKESKLRKAVIAAAKTSKKAPKVSAINNLIKRGKLVIA